MNLLSAYNINKSFKEKNVLKNVNIEIPKGQIIGLVGESGSGKTTLAKILVGLEEANKGQIHFENIEIPKKRSKTLKRKIQMLFQNSLTSFNPKFTIGSSIKQFIVEDENFKELPKEEINSLIINYLAEVGLEEEIKDRYPHQVSGGQIQRASIARALSCKPSILLADEPSSALDIKSKIQILNLFKEVVLKRNLTILIITHDILSLKNLCESLYIMEEGLIVETGKTNEILQNPKTKYVNRLISAIPKLIY